MRRELGLREEVPAVLLVGGGEGMGPVEKTVTSIARAVGPRVQLVVICGRNERLIRRLSEKVQLDRSQAWRRNAQFLLPSYGYLKR